jgi:hypothetical protein
VTIEEVVRDIQSRLGLEADIEHEVLEEIRGHLEEAVAAGTACGLDERHALNEAAAAFGVEQTTSELRQTHAGRGTMEGVAAAALPVILALILRWLIFAPDGTMDAWRELLTRPALVVIAVATIAAPLVRFPQRRPAIALWTFFWGLSFVTLVWPASRW